MRIAWLGCLMWSSLLLAGSQENEINVNSRYTVDSVVLAGDGWRINVNEKGARVGASLRQDLQALVGEKLNPAQLDDLAGRIRREFHARRVTLRVLRGASPESVGVVFEITSKPARFDLSVPRFLYSSRQGWNGAVEGAVSVRDNSFTTGLVSNGDELVERYTGLTARYENKRLGTNRVGLRFEFDSFHEQWDNNTRKLADGRPVPANFETSGLYRTRQNFEPSLKFTIAKPLTLTVGTSFEHFQTQYPTAQTQAANAAITTLRFHQRVEGSEIQQELDAGYHLRAATRSLQSDYVYSRHRLHFRYTITRGHHALFDEVNAGFMNGRAPLFERFVLGNASTLRGWDKYELDPLGGNRMVHNSVEYRYGVFQVFYDTGSVWDRGHTAVARHALGVGLRQGAFSVALACPVKDGRAEPVLLIGMNY